MSMCLTFHLRPPFLALFNVFNIPPQCVHLRPLSWPFSMCLTFHLCSPFLALFNQKATSSHRNHFYQLFFLFYFNICNHVRYVSFHTNLNLFSKKETMKTLLSFRTSLLLIMLGLLLSECEKDQIILFICTNSNCVTVFGPAQSISKLYRGPYSAL